MVPSKEIEINVTKMHTVAVFKSFHSSSLKLSFQAILTQSLFFQDGDLGLAHLSSYQLQIRAWEAEDHLRRFLRILLVHLPSLCQEHRKTLAFSSP